MIELPGHFPRGCMQQCTTHVNWLIWIGHLNMWCVVFINWQNNSNIAAPSLLPWTITYMLEASCCRSANFQSEFCSRGRRQRFKRLCCMLNPYSPKSSQVQAILSLRVVLHLLKFLECPLSLTALVSLVEPDNWVWKITDPACLSSCKLLAGSL